VKVILAQPRGFCAGVVRAIEVVERALKKYGPPVYVRHEIVHNKWVVESLRAKGARFVESLSEIPPNGITIFSAHGVSKQVEREAKERGLHVLNATCPLVSKVHSHGRHYARTGRTTILIGHANHPEVEGTLGQIAGPVLLIQSERDVERLDLPPETPIAYLTQTTLSIDDTRSVIDALYRRFSDVVGPGTADICYATQNRQVAVRELAKLVEVILVVGAANSSNSNRLCEIGRACGVETHLVADGDEVRPEWVRDRHAVGVTAGASAPEVMVMDVVDRLGQTAPIDVSTLAGPAENLEFRVPVELLDVNPSRNISKDKYLEHSASAETICR
jgi:4-hydroxy-3-methylbut-2-en-1-yl diphosphate reductase